MKNILLCSFLICALFASSQSKWKEERKKEKEHQAIADTANFSTPFEFTFIDSSTLSKQELFSKINTWLPTVFTNSNISITKDSLAGKFVLARVVSSYSRDYTYNLTIDVRNNKYRLSFTDFVYTSSSQYSITYSMDATEKIPTIVFTGTKKSYWQNEKLYLRENAQLIYLSAKAYIDKKDDF